MGLRKNPPRVMQWMGPLDAMIAAGGRARRVCTHPCPFWENVDLAAMVRLLGRDGSLWDRQPPCETCGRLTHFMASPGEGTVFRPLLSTHHQLHQLPPQAWMGGWTGKRS